MADRPNRDIDQLYTVAPTEFTRVRNAMAARLRAAGRTAQAAEVKRLRKPMATVWAINQVAREAPDGVTDFIDAFDRVKRAQSGDSGGLPRAIESERRARQHLLDLAVAQLTASGSPPTAGTVQRVAATLLGAVADPAARADLRAGRLTREHQAPGFELLAGTPIRRRAARTSGSRPPAAALAGAEKRSSRRAADQRRDREAARVAEREARERRRRAEALERAAADHRRAAEKAGQTAQALKRRLDQLEQLVAERREAAEDATREAERLRALQSQ